MLPNMVVQKGESVASTGSAGTQAAGGPNVFLRTVLQLYSFALPWLSLVDSCSSFAYGIILDIDLTPLYGKKLEMVPSIVPMRAAVNQWEEK